MNVLWLHSVSLAFVVVFGVRGNLLWVNLSCETHSIGNLFRATKGRVVIEGAMQSKFNLVRPPAGDLTC